MENKPEPDWKAIALTATDTLKTFTKAYADASRAADEAAKSLWDFVIDALDTDRGTFVLSTEAEHAPTDHPDDTCPTCPHDTDPQPQPVRIAPDPQPFADFPGPANDDVGDQRGGHGGGCAYGSDWCSW